MKVRMRIVFLFCVALFLFGVFVWIIPSENMIKATNAHSRELLQKALVDERALNDEPRVRFLAQRIRNDLKGLRLRPFAGDTNQALLGDLEETAARNRLTVAGIKPVVADAVLVPARADEQNASAPPPQESEISVRGGYRNVVYFLEDLSHMPTLARVLSVQLDHASDDAAGNRMPLIDATVRIQMIRLDRAISP